MSCRLASAGSWGFLSLGILELAIRAMLLFGFDRITLIAGQPTGRLVFLEIHKTVGKNAAGISLVAISLIIVHLRLGSPVDNPSSFN